MNDFLTAAADAVRSHDPTALKRALAQSTASREQTKHSFREELPLLLNPPDLLWLLQEMTSPEEFEAKRDHMITALCDDLCRNSYVPGNHFSVLADNTSGKTVHITQSVWDSMQQHLSPKALQHYKCFITIREG